MEMQKENGFYHYNSLRVLINNPRRNGKPVERQGRKAMSLPGILLVGRQAASCRYLHTLSGSQVMHREFLYKEQPPGEQAVLMQRSRSQRTAVQEMIMEPPNRVCANGLLMPTPTGMPGVFRMNNVGAKYHV